MISTRTEHESGILVNAGHGRKYTVSFETYLCECGFVCTLWCCCRFFIAVGTWNLETAINNSSKTFAIMYWLIFTCIYDCVSFINSYDVLINSINK